MTKRRWWSEHWLRAKRWSWLLLLPVGGFLAVRVHGLVTGPSSTLPAPHDVEYAARVLDPEARERGRVGLADPALIGGNGVVEPRSREIRVAGAVPGRVAEVLVREGQWVEQGEPVVALESAVQRAAVRAARAEADAARASLQRTLAGDRPEQRQAAEADARQAEAIAQLNERAASRIERLADAGAVPLDEQDRARQRAVADRAAADAADARRRASVGGARVEDRAVARAALESAEGRLAQAEAALEQLVVRAPERGEILQVRVRVGEYYLPGGEPLVVLGDTSELLARVDVDERDVAGLVLGARATLRVPAWPDRTFEGTVTEIGRRMGRKNVRTDDPVERNDVKILEVLVALEDREALRVGQRVVASIARAAGPRSGQDLVAEAPVATVPPG